MPLWPFRRDATADRAHDIYVALVNQARRPEFYAPGGVPDSVDGRFELILLHATLVIRRLNAAGPDGKVLAQAVFDALFGDMDRNLRDMGIADIRVGRRVKNLATAFYGRAKAYEEGMAAGQEALAEAIRRNLLDGPAAAAMAAYVLREAAHLAGQSDAQMIEGLPVFGPPPGISKA